MFKFRKHYYKSHRFRNRMDIVAMILNIVSISGSFDKQHIIMRNPA
jgi:hypothetical protein